MSRSALPPGSWRVTTEVDVKWEMGVGHEEAFAACAEFWSDEGAQAGVRDLTVDVTPTGPFYQA